MIKIMETCISNLKHMYNECVKSVCPERLMHSVLKVQNDKLIIDNVDYKLNKNLYVVGFGKAVEGMATELYNSLVKDHIRQGIISVPEGTCNESCVNKWKGSTLKIMEGGKNNLPDNNSLKAAYEIKQLVERLKENDVLIVLISGGGSALLPYPKSPITIEEKLQTIQLLVKKGANIQELNSVRKKLSELKGGKLAQLAYPSKVISFVLSDVIGDPLDIIASGPTVPDTDKETYALEVIKKYDIVLEVPINVRSIMSSEEKVNWDFGHVQNIIIGNNEKALKAAQVQAQEYGYSAIILSRSVEGLVDDIAVVYSRLIECICRFSMNTSEVTELNNELRVLLTLLSVTPIEIDASTFIIKECKPLCLISGGEPTVNIHGTGIGGRNQELSLHVALQLNKLISPKLADKFEIVFLSAGTDGIDGPTDSAGAISYTSLVEDAIIKGLDVEEYIRNNDSNTFYKKFNDGNYLINVGHTGTNVMDVHFILIRFKN